MQSSHRPDRPENGDQKDRVKGQGKTPTCTKEASATAESPITMSISPNSSSNQQWNGRFGRITGEPTPVDILLGRGRPFQDWSGNRRMREVVVERFMVRYQNARRHEKRKIIEDILEILKKAGVRFLKRRVASRVEEEDGWVEVEHYVAFEKVSHALRRKPREEPPVVRDPEPNVGHGQTVASSTPIAFGHGIGSTVRHPVLAQVSLAFPPAYLQLLATTNPLWRPPHVALQRHDGVYDRLLQAQALEAFVRQKRRNEALRDSGAHFDPRF
jgi:hypothetical protein